MVGGSGSGGSGVGSGPGSGGVGSGPGSGLGEGEGGSRDGMGDAVPSEGLPHTRRLKSTPHLPTGAGAGARSSRGLVWNWLVAGPSQIKRGRVGVRGEG